jgi:acetate kinase
MCRAKAAAGNREAAFAYNLYTYRIKKYIGSFAAILNGLDAIVFTAGVGENDATTRRLVCAEMDYLSIILDEKKNAERSGTIRDIGADGSRTRILVVPYQ